jgi:hypothetical protein
MATIIDRCPDGPAIPNIAFYKFYPKACQVTAPAGSTDESTHRKSGLDQFSHDCGADESARSSNKNGVSAAHDLASPSCLASNTNTTPPAHLSALIDGVAKYRNAAGEPYWARHYGLVNSTLPIDYLRAALQGPGRIGSHKRHGLLPRGQCSVRVRPRSSPATIRRPRRVARRQNRNAPFTGS